MARDKGSGKELQLCEALLEGSPVTALPLSYKAAHTTVTLHCRAWKGPEELQGPCGTAQGRDGLGGLSDKGGSADRSPRTPRHRQSQSVPTAGWRGRRQRWSLDGWVDGWMENAAGAGAGRCRSPARGPRSSAPRADSLQQMAPFDAKNNLLGNKPAPGLQLEKSAFISKTQDVFSCFPLMNRC